VASGLLLTYHIAHLPPAHWWSGGNPTDGLSLLSIGHNNSESSNPLLIEIHLMINDYEKKFTFSLTSLPASITN